MEEIAAGSHNEAVARVTRGYTEAFGRPPESVGFAPGRVNLIGEHLDYNGGPCLPIALAHGTWAAVGPSSDEGVRCASAQQPDVVTVTLGERAGGWTDYVAGVLWAADLPPASVYVDGTVPLGAGLSSSAALECSVGVALGLTGDALRDAAIRAEGEYVGAPTGGLDQTVSVFGRAHEATLVDFGDDSREQVPFDPGAAGLALLVVDTHVEHALSHGDGGYGQRRAESEEAALRLGVARLADARADSWDAGDLTGLLAQRARHVVSETARVRRSVEVLGAGDWSGFGALMTASHRSLQLDYQVSCHELDTVVDAALESGALGARMTGGGFGGSAIALVPQARVTAVLHRVEAGFADEGWDPPSFLVAEAGPGAHQR